MGGTVESQLGGSKLQLFDGLVAAGLLCASVYVYELANFVAFSALGFDPSFSFGSLLPSGVSASVPASPLLPLVKPLQIGFSASSMLCAFLVARSRSLHITKTVALATSSIYVASCYWEVLSLMGTIGYEAHIAMFTLLAMGSQLGLWRLLKA